MYKEMGQTTLKTGETLTLGVVTPPDKEWGERLTPFLDHKGEPWNWQNRSILLGPTGRLESYYYVAHLGEDVFSNVCTWEYRGAGMLGHVFTAPKHRRKGAYWALMEVQMEDFRDRGGGALYLGTGFDTVPWHIYYHFGFRPIYPESGHMEYFTESREGFESRYFREGDHRTRVVEWEDWAALNTLTCASEGPALRLYMTSAIGRSSFEGPFLDFYREISVEGTGQAKVLEVKETGSVVGLAHLAPDSRYGGSVDVLDLLMHPRHDAGMHQLVESIDLEGSRKVQAYVGSDDSGKQEFLASLGFAQEVVLERQLAPTGASAPIDVSIMSRLA